MSQVIIPQEPTTSKNAELTVSQTATADDGSRTRRWMLTVSLSASDGADFNLEDVVREMDSCVSGLTGAVGQIERGDKTGYLHWQLYVEHRSALRFKQIKERFPTAHIGEARESRAVCVRYCTKEDTREYGPFWWGDIRLEDYQGKRNDLESLRDAVLMGTPVDELLATGHSSVLRVYNGLRELEAVLHKRTAGQTTRALSVEYLWGGTGTGKTFTTFERFGYENVYRLIDYGRGAMDQYAGEPVLFLDEFASQIKITELLGWLDVYPLQVSARYRNRWAMWTTVIIASNAPLDEQYREPSGSSTISAEQRRALERRIARVAEVRKGGVFVDEIRGARG